jgi:hypothetical protein
LHVGNWYRPDELAVAEKLCLEEDLVNLFISGEDKTVLLSVTGSDSCETIRASTLGCDCGERLGQLKGSNDVEYRAAYEMCEISVI